ncbi:MFS transporter [Sporolactobacillus shoreae]|uniref:MFS transporter n=1 Tax=Sporolactobacillus shoreae TaxID=1465501 RepID=UPI003BAA3E57
MSAVYPIYFAGVAKSSGIAGDVWWGYATSAASLLIAALSPFIGAIGDFRGMKKRLLAFFLTVGVIFTLLMAITDHPVLMLVGYIFSFIGFEGSILFYDSFLTDVTTRDRMDRVSSYGYAMGYIGGSTIPFIISIALILFGGHFGIGGALAVKISVVMTAVWWALFSLPLLRHVKQIHYVDTPPARLVRHSLTNLRKTISEIFHNKKLLFFMIAYFFYIDGVGTVITMSTSYGSTLGLGSTGMILALMLTQLLAVPFSILFGRLSGKIGTLKMIQGGVLIYMIICLLGFYMGFSLEPHQRAYENAYNNAVTQADVPLDQATLSAIKVKGSALLSRPDRAEAFASMIDDLSLGKNPTEKARLEKLKSSVTVFLKDEQQAKGFTDAINFSTILFWMLAILVSTSQGGVQALSRSYFSKMIPPERSNESFGFFDIFGKFASVIGPFLYSFFAAVTGRSSIGILSLLLLFGIGFAALSRSKKQAQ